MWGVSVQCRRLAGREPEDDAFVFRRLADFDFLIVALVRLRRAAMIGARIPETKQIISAAIEAFDAALPGLKKLRDVAEHIDEYAVDSGRDRSVSRKELETSFPTEDLTLNWLGQTINAGEALHASQALFAAIQSASAAFAGRG
jgi:hypothetical protein